MGLLIGLIASLLIGAGYGMFDMDTLPYDNDGWMEDDITKL